MFGHYLAWTLEILVLVLTILERSRIARFLSTKIALDVVVEVTDRFGREAGHRLSTFLAAIVAEPMIVCYIVAGILVVINLIVLIVRSARRKKCTEY